MASSEKNILITPATNTTDQYSPTIVFTGANSTTSAQNITLSVYPDNSGTVAFAGAAGNLLTIDNTAYGVIYSVNDVSGIPSLEVLDDGTVRLNPLDGNVLIGTTSNPSNYKLNVNGEINATDVKVNGKSVSAFSMSKFFAFMGV